MKANVYNLTGNKTKSIDLPEQFNEEIRPDVVMRAFLAWQSENQQPYGAYPEAGKRVSAKISRRRRQFKTAYGIGISRVPRKILWRRGTQFGWVGAYAPGTYKGRRAHPPKAQKILEKNINKKERRKALRSALAASCNIELVKQRGHRIVELPNILESQFESLNRTKDVMDVLMKLKLDAELERSAIKKVRAGRGKGRGRKYRTRAGPLIVVSEPCPVIKSAQNIAGVDVCQVNTLNIGLLAPGGKIGRLILFTEKAIEKMQTEKLFTNEGKPKVKEIKTKSVKQEKPVVKKETVKSGVKA